MTRALTAGEIVSRIKSHVGTWRDNTYRDTFKFGGPETEVKGIVTADDVLDVVQEEATEDFQKIGGLEALDLPYFRTGYPEMLRKRGGWLSLLFLGELFTASAMGFFEHEIAQAVPAIADHKGPVYMRLLRGNVPLVLDEYGYKFELGKAKTIRDGNDVLIISTGLMTMRALEAAEALREDKVDVAVLHVPTIKPLDTETILREVGKGLQVLEPLAAALRVLGAQRGRHHQPQKHL